MDPGTSKVLKLIYIFLLHFAFSLPTPDFSEPQDVAERNLLNFGKRFLFCYNLRGTYVEMLLSLKLRRHGKLLFMPVLVCSVFFLSTYFFKIVFRLPVSSQLLARAFT